MPKKKIGGRTKVRPRFAKSGSKAPRHVALKEQLRRKNVLVIGDVMLDERIEGRVERMSPESPTTPVLLLERREYNLGGAANTAANVASLGAQPILVGTVGDDRAGLAIRRILPSQSIRDCLVTISGRPTVVKTRVYHQGEHLVRIDEEKTTPLPRAAAQTILDLIRSLAEDIHFVIISDYAKGTITPELVRELTRLFGANRIIADLKPKNFKLARGLRAIKPNRKEAEEMVGQKIKKSEHAILAAQKLSAKLQSSVLLTLGEGGMVAYEKHDGCASHVPAETVRLIEVAGAGDVVIAAAALALVLGYDLHQAARFANRAAACAVAKPGVATVTLEEIYKPARWSKVKSQKSKVKNR